ncbi:MAG TPA: subclass B3 metallo-beta-lactamase [Burkholderiales bacterium]|nr:subclass B3 metallo-beta-lactamase [Burkholderiales bacterium]
MNAAHLAAAVLVAALAAATPPASQAQGFRQLPITNEAYVRPFEPLRIIGNLYYVGTYDLAVYLITTREGNILINTGVNDSVPGIRANIEKLGFKFGDIKLLLATHGHWDHVAGMAEIKQLTGARMLMHEDDAELLETGGGYDFRFPNGRGSVYEPVKVDQKLKDGDRVRLGEVELTLHHHPGHTKGASSFTYTLQEAGRSYDVLIVNMGSINPGVQVSFMPAFPRITEAYGTTLAKQKQMKPDVWVASHAAQFDLHKKYKPGDAYDPNRFVDPAGYQAKIEYYEKLYQTQLAKERAAKAQ